MKAFVIILAVVCAVLIYALFQRNSSASRAAAAAETQFQNYSNQVAELSTKLALERGSGGQVQSNLQSLVDRRVGELINTSNRLVQLNLLYRAAQSDARAAQSEAQSLTAKLAVLEAERDGLQRNLTAVAVVERKLAEARDKLATTTSERNALLQEVGKLEVDRADLLRKLEDVGFLRVQLTKAEDNAVVLRRLAKAGNTASVSSKARLELLEDGTVRPAIPVNGGGPR